VRLPRLELVDPSLAVTGQQDVTAQWSTPRAGPYELTFEVAKEVPVWRTVAAQSPATVDPRLLEDTSGRAVLAGTFDDAIEGSDVTLTWRSPGVAYVGGMGPPPSRGMPCRFMDGAGASTPRQECALTDGDLTTAASPGPPVCAEVARATTTTGCAGATWAVVDLTRPVPAELVAIRGCEQGCAVEVSEDGTTFRPVGTAGKDFGAIDLDGRPIASVRVSLAEFGARLREISVWGPRPSRPALRTIAARDQDRLRRPFTGEPDGRGARSWLMWLALALAGAALLAVGFALGRRRASGPRLRA
jgi:hypothetical protein